MRGCDVAGVAARQRGLITRGQLLGAGLSGGAIDGRVASGRLFIVHRGIYAVGHPGLAPLAEEQAAVLACGDRSVLSHAVAAAVRELIADRGPVIDVTVTGTQRRPPAGVRIHRTTTTESTRYRGLPVTTVRQTLLDLAATNHPALSRALNEAQVKKLVSLDELLTFAQGRPGAKALRALATESPGYTRSKAERLLLALTKRADLPRPRTNTHLLGYEIDAVWPQHRLALEVDGWAAHSTRRAFERDRIRDADLQIAGYRVLRVTWERLTRRPEAVAAQIGAALAVPTRA